MSDTNSEQELTRNVYLLDTIINLSEGYLDCASSGRLQGFLLD